MSVGLSHFGQAVVEGDGVFVVVVDVEMAAAGRTAKAGVHARLLTTVHVIVDGVREALHSRPNHNTTFLSRVFLRAIMYVWS